MGKLFAVIRREYLERVRSKWFIVATVFGPVFFGAIMILPTYLSMKGMKDTKVGKIEVLDLTGTDLGQRVVGRLVGPMADTGSIAVRALASAQLAEAESTLTKAVMREELRGYLVLDSLTLAGRQARYAGRNASSVGEMEVLEGAVRQGLLAMRLEREGMDPLRVDALTKVRVQMQTERITDKGRGGSGLASAIFGFVIAFLLYMSIILYGQGVMRGVLEEKTTRVAEVIVASVKPDVLLAGKVLGVGAVGLTQMLIWAGSSYGMYQVRGQVFSKLGMGEIPAIGLPSMSPAMFVALLLFFVLGYLFYSSLFAAVGAMVNTLEEAQQAAQPVLMLLVTSIIFVQPIMFNPTSTMAKVMSWLPFSAPIIMPLRMSAVAIGWGEIAGVLLGLVVACSAAVWLSARIYRVGLLMYGKRPSLGELVRWVRYS